MAVAIRLSRMGRKNRPVWRVVAVDSHARRDGACIETLGTYDPIRHTIIAFDIDRINDWISKGAQCSDSVRRLIKMHTKANS